MNILILGSGAREHALAWKIQSSPHTQKLFVAPGNAGIAEIAECVNLDLHHFESILSFCTENKIDIVVVGPEEPLVKGLYDYLRNNHWPGIIVGCSAQAAQLEGSKFFAKQFMERYNIPTASYKQFSKQQYNEAVDYVTNQLYPVVIKADGLAAGKGVFICQTQAEARECLHHIFIDNQFGQSGDLVVIESFLQGIEVSVFVLTNGNDYQIIGHAKDYKRIGEGDVGLNTGGMGCVSPVPFMTDDLLEKIDATIIKPTIRGIQTEQLTYSGFIFFGLMICNGEPFVIEYNCRLGDPETEVILPRLETDLVALFAAMDNGTLCDANVFYEEDKFATIIAASAGYPLAYQKNKPIQFTLDNQNKSSIIFHAATQKNEDVWLTNGGRVLAITSKAETIQQAVNQSLQTLQHIHFDGIYYRRDIGYEFM